MDSASFFFKLLAKKNGKIDVILKNLLKISVQNWTPTVSNCFPDFYKYTLRIQNVHREGYPLEEQPKQSPYAALAFAAASFAGVMSIGIINLKTSRFFF